MEDIVFSHSQWQLSRIDELNSVGVYIDEYVSRHCVRSMNKRISAQFTYNSLIVGKYVTAIKSIGNLICFFPVRDSAPKALNHFNRIHRVVIPKIFLHLLSIGIIFDALHYRGVDKVATLRLGSDK